MPLTDLHFFFLDWIHPLLESDCATEAKLGFGFPHGTPERCHRPASQMQIIISKQVFRELTPCLIGLTQPWRGMPSSIWVQLLLRDERLLHMRGLGGHSSGLKQLNLAVRVNIGLFLPKGLQVKHACFLVFVKPVEFGVENRTYACQSYKNVACELIGLHRPDLTIYPHRQDSYGCQ